MVRSSLRFAFFSSALVLLLGGNDCCGPSNLDPTLETACNDAVDDDGDTLMDCGDPDCRDAVPCVAMEQDCAPPDSDEDGGDWAIKITNEFTGGKSHERKHHYNRRACTAKGVRYYDNAGDNRSYLGFDTRCGQDLC
jgi:hypothetical protein